MKARAFDYVRPTTVEAALRAFADCPGEARWLAGGQSLLPALNLRLDAPDLLVDIGRIEVLRGITLEEDRLRIGALTRHAEILASPLVAVHAPLLPMAAAFVAHPAVRNQGTMGGSLAFADPTAEFPAVAVALGADIEITGRDGVRTMAADDFFVDLYETALRAGEIVSALLVPVRAPGHRAAFRELSHRRGDYAIVGLAAWAAFGGSRVAEARLAFSAVGPKPIRARRAEACLAGQLLDAEAIRAAQAALADDITPDGDMHVAAATRAHLAKVILGRALADLRDDDLRDDDLRDADLRDEGAA